MYEAFYGFKEKPFSMLPDPGFLFLSKKHQTALTLLEYGLLNHVGFCIISGEPGAGKTTILRALLDRIGDDVTVGLITNTHQSFGGLLDWVLSVFDLHQPNLSHVEMHQRLMEFLIEEYAKNRTVLLIVDEAQNMNADSLEELRMLSNVNSEKDQLLQVVLAGQPELKDMLRKPELMQFAQRIAVDYHLAPLSAEETCGYIQHRLVTAGAQEDVFTPAACERIFNYSGGTPRLINLLCETVLVYGFADQNKIIDVDLVDEMVLERMKDSVVPIVNREVARQDNSVASKKLEENFPWIRTAGEAPVIEEVQQQDREPPVLKDQIADDQPTLVKTVAAEETESGDTAENKNPQKVALDKKTEPQADAVRKPPATAGKENAETEAAVARQSGSQASGVQSSDAPASSITGGAIPPAGEAAGNGARKQLVKYGAIALLIGLILIGLAIVLNDDSIKKSELIDQQNVEQATIQEAQQQQEKKRLQLEAEKLKQERDTALLKIEEEKRAKEKAQQAAKLAAAEAVRVTAEKAKAAKAVKVGQEKLRKEQQRVVWEKEKVREAQYETERAKRRTARLEEEKRFKAEADARRLELERLEAQRQAQAKKIVAPVSSGEKNITEAAQKKPVSADCSGPTARFKSNCR